MDQILLQLGIGVTSNAIYDFLRGIFVSNPEINRLQLKNILASFLNIQNANIAADKIITFLAKNGDMKIKGTDIYANDLISMFSAKNTKFTFGNDSSSTTKNTKIKAGNGAFIQGQGGAGIKQNEDESISFFA